jgi:hypothetical protein
MDKNNLCFDLAISMCNFIDVLFSIMFQIMEIVAHVAPLVNHW